MRHFLSFGYKQIKRMMVSLVGGTDIRKQRRKRRALRPPCTQRWNGIKQIDLLNRPRTLARFKWFLKRPCQQGFLLLKKCDSIAVFVSIESFQKWPGLSKTPPTENTKDILFEMFTQTPSILAYRTRLCSVAPFYLRRLGINFENHLNRNFVSFLRCSLIFSDKWHQ